MFYIYYFSHCFITTFLRCTNRIYLKKILIILKTHFEKLYWLCALFYEENLFLSIQDEVVHKNISVLKYVIVNIVRLELKQDLFLISTKVYKTYEIIYTFYNLQILSTVKICCSMEHFDIFLRKYITFQNYFLFFVLF